MNRNRIAPSETPQTSSNPDLTKGPIETRHCTDLLMFLIFLLFWGGMWGLTGYALKNGNPLYLVAPVDSHGNRCGLTPSVSDKPVLYWPDPYNLKLQWCVKSCPNNHNFPFMKGEKTNDLFSPLWLAGFPNPDSSATVQNGLFSCARSDADVKRTICNYGIDNLDIVENITAAIGADIIIPRDVFLSGHPQCFCPYRSNEVLYRCVPEVDFSQISKMSESFTSQTPNGTAITAKSSPMELLSELSASFRIAPTMSQVYSDIEKVYWIFAVAAILGLVFGFVWLLLLRMFARAMVWVTIYVVIGLQIAFSIWIWEMAVRETDAINQSNQKGRVVTAQEEKNAYALKYTSYVLVALTGILILLTLFMRRRIAIAIAVIQEASSAMMSMTSIVFFPFVICAFLIVFHVFWIWVGIYLASIEIKEQSLISTTSTTTTATTTTTTKTPLSNNPSTLQYLQLYWVLGYFWNVQFFIAIGQCTVAGAVSGWYWCLDKRQISKAPISSSFYRTIRYHLGSMAFGALIIAIVQTVRAMISYIQGQLYGRKNSRIISCVLWCMDCCFACVERFLKFINRNAYILIAAYGYSFCRAAREAFSLILSNIMIMAAVNMVGDFLLFLGKIAVATSVGFICAAILLHQQISFWYIPTIICVLIGYAVAAAFMTIYEMAIDTILLCFCIEVKDKHGTSDKPFFASERLRRLIDSTQKQEEKKLLE